MVDHTPLIYNSRYSLFVEKAYFRLWGNPPKYRKYIFKFVLLKELLNWSGNHVMICKGTNVFRLSNFQPSRPIVEVLSVVLAQVSFCHVRQPDLLLVEESQIQRQWNEAGSMSDSYDEVGLRTYSL